jgi:hypothetical protein
MRSVLLVLLALGCGSDEGDGPPRSSPDTGTSPSLEVASVVSAVRFVGAEGGVTEGFDLDGRVSDAGDPQGCGKEDLVDPDGVEGIDNAFSGLVPVLMATEASALEDLLAQSIANGELLLLVEVGNVDVDTSLPVEDWDDDCVDLTLWRGDGVPLLAADGTLLDRQTFATSDPVTVSCVPMVAGKVEAQGFSVVLPAQVLDVELTLHLSDAALRIEHLPDGTAVGLLGGGIPRSDFEAILSEQDIQDLAQVLLPIVEGLLDLEDDSGACSAMSVTLGFDALPAFVAR